MLRPTSLASASAVLRLCLRHRHRLLVPVACNPCRSDCTGIRHSHDNGPLRSSQYSPKRCHPRTRPRRASWQQTRRRNRTLPSSHTFQLTIGFIPSRQKVPHLEPQLPRRRPQQNRPGRQHRVHPDRHPDQAHLGGPAQSRHRIDHAFSPSITRISSTSPRWIKALSARYAGRRFIYP